MLDRAIALRREVATLKPFDEAILAAILIKAGDARAADATDLFFCDLDGDLVPIDRKGNPRKEFVALYAAAGPVANLEPMELAGNAAQDDSPRSADARRFGLIQRHLTQGRDRLMAVEPLSPRIQPQLRDPPQLLGPACLKGIRCVRHSAGFRVEGTEDVAATMSYGF